MGVNNWVPSPCSPPRPCPDQGVLGHQLDKRHLDPRVQPDELADGLGILHIAALTYLDAVRVRRRRASRRDVRCGEERALGDDLEQLEFHVSWIHLLDQACDLHDGYRIVDGGCARAAIGALLARY